MKVTGSIILAIALTGAFARHGPRSASLSERRVTVASSEQQRLRAHFDSVDAELRRVEVSGLTENQRASRRELVAWLRDYRDAGVFPRNDRLDKAMPFFRDSRGALCAMAYLISRSGRPDIVDRIARSRNNAFIRELADDRALVRWSDSVGITLGEAARIQPGYRPAPEPGAEAGRTVGTDYALASMIISGTALTTAGLNAFAPSRTSGWLGVVTGGLAVATGYWAIYYRNNTNNTDEGLETLAAANLVAGAATIGLGIRGLVLARHKPSAASQAPGARTGDLAIVIEPRVRSTRQGPAIALSIRGRF